MLFLASSNVYRKVGPDEYAPPHRTIQRIIDADSDFGAICKMEEHIRKRELLFDDESIDLTEAWEVIA